MEAFYPVSVTPFPGINFEIQEDSSQPKYQQIIKTFIREILKKNIRVGQKIPSINELSADCYLSRDTVEKAYKILRKKNLIYSVPGKGYYVSESNLAINYEVFFMMSKPNEYKLSIYTSFAKKLGQTDNIELLVYNSDEDLFNQFQMREISSDHYFVLMPDSIDAFSKENLLFKNKLDVLQRFQKENLVLINNKLAGINDIFGEVYVDFEEDIYHALEEIKGKLEAYSVVNLVYSEDASSMFPVEIIYGFRKFCIEHKIEYNITNKAPGQDELATKSAYILLTENDLFKVVKLIRKYDLKYGKDIGIVSYNYSPLKELMGVTTISTDYSHMGAAAARMLLNHKNKKVKNMVKVVNGYTL